MQAENTQTIRRPGFRPLLGAAAAALALAASPAVAEAAVVTPHVVTPQVVNPQPVAPEVVQPQAAPAPTPAPAEAPDVLEESGAGGPGEAAAAVTRRAEDRGPQRDGPSDEPQPEVEIEDGPLLTGDIGNFISSLVCIGYMKVYNGAMDDYRQFLINAPLDGLDDSSAGAGYSEFLNGLNALSRHVCIHIRAR